MQSIAIGLAINAVLAIIKGVAGVLGNSYALIADAIESASDVLSSLVVLGGLKMAKKPPDENHPYGHGKFEPLSATVVALMLLTAAIFIAVKSIEEIYTPNSAPEPFTLVILGIVIVVKEGLFRFIHTTGNSTESIAVKTDAWHHRGDVITSLAAFIGITVALLGGSGYESADDVAALFAAFVIAANALWLFRPALLELLDTAPSQDLVDEIRLIAAGVSGVHGTHKCHVRKVGFDHFVDLDILCEPSLSIREGHEIAHNVGEAIHRELPNVTKVLVHVEPLDDYGRRVRDHI